MMNKKINKKVISSISALTAVASIVAIANLVAEPKFTQGNYNGSGLEEVNNEHKFRYFIVNGKVIGDADPVVIDDITFVSAPDILDALGIEYDFDKTNEILTVTIDDDEYVFESMNAYYTKNGEKKYIKETTQNGISVPSNVTRNRCNYGKMFIPLSFFTKELGYSDAFTVSDTWDLTMGTGIKFSNIGKTQKTESFTGEKYNKAKTIEEGWVCPILKSVSQDNLVDDAQTLQKELEFDENGSTSAMFNPESLKGISVGPYAFGTNASHFTNICVRSYGDTSTGAHKKINQVMPQVIKFYYPNSWQKVDEILKKEGSAVRYTIDGRDTVIEGKSGNIFMSRVNGSLKGDLANIAVSGTIGKAYNVQTSNTGCWTKYGTQNWYYLDANQNVVKGWKQINGKWYYFDVEGRMVTNTTVNGYKIGTDGVWIP